MNRTTYDVVVVGAGAAGLAASVSAARHGARTLLIEKYGFLGGTTTMGLVHHWDPVKMIESSGIIMEVYDRLKAMGALVDFDKSDSVMPFSYWEGGCGFDPEAYKAIWMDMLEEAGVCLLLHTTLVGASVAEDKIKSVTVQNKSGLFEITGKMFVDASGDGDLIFHSGCRYKVGDDSGVCWSPTLAFRLGGVDTEQIYQYFDENPDQFGNHPRIGKYMRDYRHSAILQGFYKLIKEARENGDLTIDLPEPGIGMTIQPRYGEFHVNATRTPGMNLLDGEDLTKLEIIERQKVREVFNFMRKYIPGCQNAYIMQTAEQVALRESRRLVGEYVMPIEDLVNGFAYEDSVVRAKWAHCDSHSGKNMQWSFKFYEGPFYVPYRSLLAKEVGNLLVAGRCVSASREVLSSLRIQPICACEGQAAGTAAALAATEEIAAREVDAKLLRETLKKDGVVL